MDILSGLIIGFLFGFALWKAGALRYSVIMGALLLKDFRLYGFMITTLATIVLGTVLLKISGMDIEVGIKPYWGATHFIGGGLFGIAMALLGMCPGTCIGRLACGKYEAGIGVLAILLSAFATEALLPVIDRYGVRFNEPKELAIYQYCGVGYLPAAAAFGVVLVLIMAGVFLITRKKQQHGGLQ
ncbi:YeeE/YedE thiosulfate transporter family protein [Candidatus Magnetominusculus xianensis]|uniref:Sulphur transport domain-containing protein n=1 Tax=Candidatus Magnetominusculus xianensis TaxID=1748249 RepID=A0ABR5SC84_9BACT|nr:YeeE/YedE thiosulfate transporter family protein [Candidatus Magnetominusculus xianensis]KWT79599.1 hypothetical protein ASN18_2696 [Candidatus Magnetominusculus xianensis]MBF0403812.1 YeeE/YedE family protein [Nitrospirota bacterium]